ncbi:MAG: hypothetical protein KDE33_28530, partial [Bacteroidetes bacterium]|nr:hypothetical protein [Bacteroidota bacterium]
MVKQIAILTFILLYCLLTHGQTEMESEKNLNYNIQVDTTNIAIIPLNTIQYRIFEDAKPTKLTNNDLISIEKILSHCILDYNEQ